MSPRPVEIVRRIYSDWERGEFRAVVGVFDPDVVFETFMPDSNEDFVARGVPAINEFAREWFGQWRDYRILGDEFLESGEATVFVAGRQSGVGEHSGAEVESPGYSVWTFRGDKVVRLSLHYDRRKALEAAGLRE